MDKAGIKKVFGAQEKGLGVQGEAPKYLVM